MASVLKAFRNVGNVHEVDAMMDLFFGGRALGSEVEGTVFRVAATVGYRFSSTAPATKRG